MFSYLPGPPDPTLRQPFTNAAFLPLILCYYTLAVLAILPNTFIFKISLLPIILRYAWQVSAVAGTGECGRLNHWNLLMWYDNRQLVVLFPQQASQEVRTTRKGQKTPVERPLSFGNVLLDAFDLLCNQRGIGWSWSSKNSSRPSPCTSRTTAYPSLASILMKMSFKLVVYDIAVYLVQHMRPSVNNPNGGTLFDPDLTLIPRFALAVFFTLCGGLVVYTTVDAMYHLATLIGRVVLRQPASQWPSLSDRPWMSTSITQFWSFRWHQFFRHIFVVFGARPGGKLLGQPGALIVIHDLGLWGLGHGTEFRTAGAFFLLMGVGAAMEYAFKKVTGLRVGGLLGWAWTMVWTLSWGTLMLDAWARRGLIACDFFPGGMRPGKILVDAIISRLSG
ncbi:hypothetical protein B0F90DRAFT_1809736 [Multifurca ochricompacta]|uniref:Wax synthase domain-containing protein n=1 Tax=Multifurca ochricompacta TaxID=376703 RepID=A0AAD4M5G8_9AGAM|nr:hypothetical protein B0F90DRAFT_1809736 [Multifurca ochricompacta]